MAQIRLHLSAGKAEAARVFSSLEDEFEDDGFPLANIEIDEAQKIYEVSVYLDEDTADAGEVEQRFARRLETDGCGLRPQREVLPDIDWVAKSLEGLKPVRAGRFLIHGRHDRSAVRPNDIAIEIEAGQAFGTGHHGTTSGCLTMIEHLCAARAPANALDLGTGTGVLAIALARRARIPVLATDIDPVATRVARANARINGASRHIRFETAAGFHHRCFAERDPFDLIVANILARPLMRMAPDIRANLAAGGDVVLSGILATQRRAVLSAFRLAGLFHQRTLWRGEWVTLHLARSRTRS
ncbi:50S ribosomal protein L11 methyltransferase [Oricola cellulosilytica]|uniref:Ribosomal protein L11 methyltransferase n=1 Tax=Oricola cellulosilytica TaxID=1429082 RepID=A0A4R0PFN7_9HYPH|nr:50S ribosomal protein L11 methyltransferase [Oricola cellulosilytica]TCD15225.1 50S ribosomal protein L11 methyltransferase [Oricola cellulosilytica]